MIGFEIYDIRAWLEQGLTRHLVSKHDRNFTERKKSWNSALLISLAACGITALEGNMGNIQLSANLGSSPSIYASKVASHLDVEVPVGYWPKLMKSVEAWKPLNEVALSEPDPIV